MSRKSDTSVSLGCILIFLLGARQEKEREPSYKSVAESDYQVL